MTDSANRDSTWHPRDYEAQVLVELLRLSRVTVLYGAKGAGKTTLLKTGVLPLLRPRAHDRNFAQDEKPRIGMPFPDRQAGDGTVDRGAEIVIVFDRWSNAPLTALQAQIMDMLPIESTRMAAPLPSLTDSLAAWNEELGVRFFIILDCFEQFLRAPFDRTGIAEFDDEFVRMVNEPFLAANFLLLVHDDAEDLMNRFRGRISGFGDAYLRLGEPSRSSTLSAGALSHVQPLQVTASERAEPDAGPEQSRDAPLAASSARAVGPPFAPDAPPTASQTPLEEHASQSSGARQPAIDDATINGLEQALQGARGIEPSVCTLVQPYSSDKRAQFTLDPEARGAAPGEAVPVPPTRTELRRPVRSRARLSLVTIIAGCAIAAGASYFAVYGYQRISTWQTASSAKGAAPETAHTADLSTVPVPPATPETQTADTAGLSAVPVPPATPEIQTADTAGLSTVPVPPAAPEIQTADTAGLSTVPVPPTAPEIDSVPPPSSEETSAVRRFAPPPRSPTPIRSAKPASPTPKSAKAASPAPKNAKAASPAPKNAKMASPAPKSAKAASSAPKSAKAASSAPKSAKAASSAPKLIARIAPPQADSVLPEPASEVRAVPIVATVAIDRQTAMHRELDVCRPRKFFARVVCTEKVKWKYCAPDRWNTIPECAAGDTQVTRYN